MKGLILKAGRDPDDKDRQIEDANVCEAAPLEPELAAVAVNQKGQPVDNNLDQTVQFDAPENDDDKE